MVVPQRFIADTPVSAVALGGASWSLTDLPALGDLCRPPDEDLAIRAIHAALDCGVTLIDTARAYTTASHPGHSEAIIARALALRPDGAKVLVATKGGHFRRGNEFPVDARPKTLRRHCEESLRLLGRDCIDLYQLHHLDPHVPIRTVMATFAHLRDEGLIRHIGVSNVSRAQLEEAMSVVPIASVQNQFSPFHQDDRPLVELCAQRSIAYLAYSPLGGGGTRLEGAFPAAAALARRKNVSIQRLALAWLLTLSCTIIPISGASRPQTVRDSVLAARLALTDEDLTQLDF